MLILSKILILIGFLSRFRMNVIRDEALEDSDDKIGARLATATIFVVTVLVYYFAGIFNFTSSC